MEKAQAFASRPANLAFSVMAFAGLSLLTVQLWSISSGYVLLLLMPALLVCLYQMTVTREYGMRIDTERWLLMTRAGNRSVAIADIAYLRITGHGPISRAVLVLADDSEMTIPFDLAPDPLELIRVATALDIPVRTR